VAVSITKAGGLNTQPNELDTAPGSLAVAENVVISRDGVIEVDRGFEDFSTNLPDFTPAQLISIGGTAYLHLDGGLWYNSAGTWYRKRGSFGGKFGEPWEVCAVDGVAYFCDSSAHVIYSINLSTGARSIFAGRYGVNATTDGVGGAARFYNPRGICTDGAGNLYVSDTSNYTIRKIVIATATVSTFAGTAGVSGSADATGTSATFGGPSGMWCDTAGTAIYVCDQNAIRKVTYSGAVVTTFAGSVGSTGTTDDTGTAARFNGPTGIWGDGAGVMYVVDSGNQAIRKVTYPGAVVTVFAGNPLAASGTTDATGTAARFFNPHGICSDGAGNLYVSDAGNHTIRKVTYPGAVVTTPMGVATSSGTTDGIGSAARFNNPHGLFALSSASFLLCDYGNRTVRVLYPAQAYAATIAGAVGVASSSSGALYADGIIVGPS
jgi:sugar lactone lactonase YvrE